MTLCPLTTSLLFFLLKCTVPQLVWGRKEFYFNYWSGECLGKWSLIFFFWNHGYFWIFREKTWNTECCIGKETFFFFCVKATPVFKRIWEIKESEEWGQLEKPGPHWPWIVNLLKVKGITLELWEGLDLYFEFSMYFSTSEANNFAKKILLF